MTNLQHLSEGWAPIYPAVDGDRIPGSPQRFTFLFWRFLMQFLIDKTKAFFADEAGAAALEYGLLAALIAAVIVASVGSIGTKLRSIFEFIAAKLITPSGSSGGSSGGRD
jgi:pilus assembly protein Flp/PilA